MSGLWSSGHRNHADRRLPVFLQLHRLRAASQTQARRLLCVLFLRVGGVPADARCAGYSSDCLLRASQMKADWLADVRTNALAWWLPTVAVFAALLAPVPVRVGIWAVMFAWMGTACILNFRRCGRTHCRYTGPYYPGDDRSRAGARDRPRFDNSHRMVRHRSRDPAREQAYQVGDGAGLGQVQPFLIARLNGAIDGFGGAFVG